MWSVVKWKYLLLSVGYEGPWAVDDIQSCWLLYSFWTDIKWRTISTFLYCLFSEVFFVFNFVCVFIIIGIFTFSYIWVVCDDLFECYCWLIYLLAWPLLDRYKLEYSYGVFCVFGDIYYLFSSPRSRRLVLFCLWAWFDS